MSEEKVPYEGKVENEEVTQAAVDTAADPVAQGTTKKTHDEVLMTYELSTGAMAIKSNVSNIADVIFYLEAAKHIMLHQAKMLPPQVG